MTQSPITIVGGGLAGLSLGLLLRQQGCPVTILEAGRYPRHRVCGEFISGRGQEVLRKLGVFDRCLALGAPLARTALFADEHRASRVLFLPQPALCLSRFALDALLARTFSESGGTLHREQRVSPPDAPGIIDATGRVAAMPGEGWRWFALKAHAHGVRLDADLELHFCRSGYVGLCRVEQDLVNVCGLFRRKTGEAPLEGDDRWSRLRGRRGSLLEERLGDARFDPDSTCAVGGLDCRPRRKGTEGSWSLGDARTMVPPFTGNGMSMAFETAEWAAGPLIAYATGETDWEAARQSYERRFQQETRVRLRWAGALEQLMSLPVVPAFVPRMALGIQGLWPLAFALTRGFPVHEPGVTLRDSASPP